MANKVFNYLDKIWILDNYTPYRKEVARYLDLIRTTYTGGVLMKHLNNTSRWTVILPFQPTPKDPINAYAGPQSRVHAHARNEIFEWTTIDLGFGKVPVPAVGTGLGSNGFVWYHPAVLRQYVKVMKGIPPGSGPGEALFHELVHTVRSLHGKQSTATISANLKMDNFEEFCAIVAANMYRSERGFKLMRESHRGFKALDQVDANSENFHDTYRADIKKWFIAQTAFCLDLARSRAEFNPLRFAAIELGLMEDTTPMTL